MYKLANPARKRLKRKLWPIREKRISKVISAMAGSSYSQPCSLNIENIFWRRSSAAYEMLKRKSMKSEEGV